VPCGNRGDHFVIDDKRLENGNAKPETGKGRSKWGGCPMKKPANRLVAISTLAMGFGLATPVHAEDWKAVGTFGWFAVGKSYEIDKGHIYWTGEFSGTFFNDKGRDNLFDKAAVKCPAYNDIDTDNKKNSYAGYCIITDTNGDQAYLKWRGTGNTKEGNGKFEYIGGTVKYKGISGSNFTFAGFNQVSWPDGTASGYSTWNR
jgi:hypothetical protein